MFCFQLKQCFPFVSTEMIRPVQQRIRERLEWRLGGKVSYWVDDFTIRGSLSKMADIPRCVRETVEEELHLVNEGKSCLVPSSGAEVCGFQLDLEVGSLSLNEAIIEGNFSFEELRCWAGYIVHCCNVIEGVGSLLQPF